MVSPSRTSVSTPSVVCVTISSQWAPLPWFAKHHNRRAAKAKDRLFLAALKRLIERVRLNNSPDRQSSDLHKREAPEVASLQNVYVAFVG
jgi:hypothetical protein